MTKYPRPLLRLIATLKKLPGVGSKTAERFAFHLLHWQEGDLEAFSSLLCQIKQELTYCARCHCLQENEGCLFCDAPARDTSRLCVIGSAKDAYSLESTGAYRGLYHVLGTLLCPIQGTMLSPESLERLTHRIQSLGVKEVILALDSTLEGDATSLFLKEQLCPLGLPVSRLAFGIPMGSSLEFVDGGTLARALMGRQHL